MTAEQMDYDVERWRPQVTRWCHRLCFRADDVDDATQDVMVTFLRYREGFRGGCALRTWLFRIACQAAQSYNKRGVRETVSL